MATVKHFVDNNQEDDRRLVSADVPQRAQWEIYYPAFAAAVDAGVAAVMCSYNRINSTYACQNAQTLSDLKVRSLVLTFPKCSMRSVAIKTTLAHCVAVNAHLERQLMSYAEPHGLRGIRNERLGRHSLHR